MELNDLLRENDIDPGTTLVLRHAPKEPKLRENFPWIAQERPDLFNAYQSIQYAKTEAQMAKASFVASFIAQKNGKALFVAIYDNKGSTLVSNETWWALPEANELIRWGMSSASDPRPEYRRFQLDETGILSDWKGRLIVDWPPPQINWSRWAKGNCYPVHAIAEESKLLPKVPVWRELSLTFEQMAVCPPSWRAEISRWRGIYYIFDSVLQKGYVGAAYGDENIWGRWQTHLKKGGDAVRLKQCDPKNFIFTVLTLTSHDEVDKEVIDLEKNWKKRLHTIDYGLNSN